MYAEPLPELEPAQHLPPHGGAASTAEQKQRNDMEKQTKKNTKSTKADTPETQPVSVPEGYVSVSGDVVGFYDEKSPIHIVPFAVKLFDSKIEPNKPSVLLFARLVEPAVVLAKVEGSSESVPTQADAGEIVGVWGRPGLTKLKEYAETPCFVVYKGEKDTGKPNPMKLFDVMTPKGAKPSLVPVTEDKRIRSIGVDTVWARGSNLGGSAGGGAASDADETDEIPF